MDTQKEWMTIERTPDAEWTVESARHLAGAENQVRHHIFVDAVGPDGADLRGTGPVSYTHLTLPTSDLV